MPVSARFLSPSLTRLPGSHSILIFVCVCNGNVQIYMSLIFILWFTSQPLLWPFIKMRLLCACSMFMLVSNKPNGINTHTHCTGECSTRLHLLTAPLEKFQMIRNIFFFKVYMQRLCTRLLQYTIVLIYASKTNSFEHIYEIYLKSFFSPTEWSNFSAQTDKRKETKKEWKQTDTRKKINKTKPDSIVYSKRLLI